MIKRSPHPMIRLALLGLYLAAALALTWPLALNLTSHLPLGTETSASVAYFNLWSLRWNELQISSGMANYWDAPIFYPNEGTFGYSEAMPLTGTAFWLLRGLGANYTGAYNLVLLLGLALNGYSAFLLARKLRIASGSAALAGLLALGMPFVWRELGVLQLVMVWPLLLSWRAWVSFGQRPGWRLAVSAGIWFAAAFWTSTQYALLLSLFVLPAVVIFGRRWLFSRKVWLYLIAGGLTAALLIAPVLLPQIRILKGFERSTETVTNLSAQPEDYLRLEKSSLGTQLTPWLRDEDGSGQRLYPGTGYMLLGTLGIGAAWRMGNRRWAIFCLAGVLLAGLLSLGLNLSLGEWQPYQTLRDLYPGFAQMRSPFRLAVFVQLFLAGLAGFGLQLIWRGRGNWGGALAIVLVLLTLAEVHPGMARLHDFPEHALNEEWIDWLGGQAPGAVVHIPYVDSTKSAAFETTALQMLQGLEHGHPLANGYSGFFPASHRELRRWMGNFPDAASLQLLRALGVRYAVAEVEWWNSLEDGKRGIGRADLLLLYEDELVRIYAVLAEGG